MFSTQNECCSIFSGWSKLDSTNGQQRLKKLNKYILYTDKDIWIKMTSKSFYELVKDGALR